MQAVVLAVSGGGFKKEKGNYYEKEIMIRRKML